MRFSWTQIIFLILIVVIATFWVLFGDNGSQSSKTLTTSRTDFTPEEAPASDGSTPQRKVPAPPDSQSEPNLDEPNLDEQTTSKKSSVRNDSDSLIFGSIPKESFPTQIFYNFAPDFAKDIAIKYDGIEDREPLTIRQWRQTIFELEKHKLSPNALPEYMDYLTKVKDYRWENAHENHEPILISDVMFEWIDDDLENNPELEKDAEGNYRAKEEVTVLTTNSGRYFSASLFADTFYSRLITLSLRGELIYTNTEDKILSVNISIDDKSFVIPMNETHVVDLGDQEGDKTVYLTAIRSSGQESKASFKFTLKKLQSGQWSNIKMKGGEIAFATNKLPTVTFTKP